MTKKPLSPGVRYNRACRLVGHFMNQWAQLEHEINTAIHHAFKLIYAEGAIITGNLQIRDKISILRTAVEFYSRERMSDEWRVEANWVFNRLSDFSPVRNMVAHTHFEATEDGDVRFTRVYAKTRFSEGEEIWTREITNEKCAIAQEFQYSIFQIMRELLHEPGSYLEPRWPTGMLNRLTPLYPQSPQPQEHPSSPAAGAKPKKAPRRRGNRPPKAD